MNAWLIYVCIQYDIVGRRAKHLSYEWPKNVLGSIERSIPKKRGQLELVLVQSISWPALSFGGQGQKSQTR